MGRWLKPARKFVQANTDTLRAAPVWLFSSGPLGPPEHRVPEGDLADVPEMRQSVEARGHHLFAGRLNKDDLGFVERAAVRAVHAPDEDDRDWQEIDAFAGEIAKELRGRP